jgi:hypothetical protein
MRTGGSRRRVVLVGVAGLLLTSLAGCAGGTSATRTPAATSSATAGSPTGPSAAPTLAPGSLSFRLSGAGSGVDGMYAIRDDPYTRRTWVSACQNDPTGRGPDDWMIHAGVDDPLSEAMKAHVSIALALKPPGRQVGQSITLKLGAPVGPNADSAYLFHDDGPYELDVDDRGDTATVRVSAPLIGLDNVARTARGSDEPVFLPGPISLVVDVECDRVGRPNQTPRPDALQADMQVAYAYRDLAQAFDLAAPTELLTAADRTATIDARRAAVDRLADLERAFAENLRALDLSILAAQRRTIVEPARAALLERSDATLVQIGQASDATSPSFDAAFTALLDALRREGSAAASFRQLAAPPHTILGGFDLQPPAIGAGEVVRVPGELHAAGHSFTIENGDGKVELTIDNGTNAFGLDVVAHLEFDGPRDLAIGSVAPGRTSWTFVLPGMGTCEACASDWHVLDSWGVTGFDVGSWRATLPVPILGR